MYRNDLFERPRAYAARSGKRKIRSAISPTVCALGLTSVLTDICTLSRQGLFARGGSMIDFEDRA